MICKYPRTIPTLTCVYAGTTVNSVRLEGDAIVVDFCLNSRLPSPPDTETSHVDPMEYKYIQIKVDKTYYTVVHEPHILYNEVFVENDNVYTVTIREV